MVSESSDEVAQEITVLEFQIDELNDTQTKLNTYSIEMSHLLKIMEE